MFIGGSCYLITKPYISLIVGLLGGIINTLRFEFLGKLEQKKLKLNDTTNILSLHGIPGFLGLNVTTIYVITIKNKEWGYYTNINHVIEKVGDSSGFRKIGTRISIFG